MVREREKLEVRGIYYGIKSRLKYIIDSLVGEIKDKYPYKIKKIAIWLGEKGK